MSLGVFVGAGAAFDPKSLNNYIESFFYLSESSETARTRAQLVLQEKYPECICRCVRFDPVPIDFLANAVNILKNR